MMVSGYSVNLSIYLLIHVPQDARAKPPFNLDRLKFYICTLVGPQLMWFIQSPNPQLKELILHDVRGLLNSELLAMFLTVAPTLTTLEVNRCEFKRSFPTEEFAIDATVSSMTSLRKLVLHGNFGSELLVGRRTEQPKVGLHPHVTLNSSAINWNNLPKALEVTTWASVYFYKSAIAVLDDAMKQKLRDIATRRNIVLKALDGEEPKPF
jgi:hypothetical protein